jgi:hypothetical protein
MTFMSEYIQKAGALNKNGVTYSQEALDRAITEADSKMIVDSIQNILSKPPGSGSVLDQEYGSKISALLSKTQENFLSILKDTGRLGGCKIGQAGDFASSTIIKDGSSTRKHFRVHFAVAKFTNNETTQLKIRGVSWRKAKPNLRRWITQQRFCTI